MAQQWKDRSGYRELEPYPYPGPNTPQTPISAYDEDFKPQSNVETSEFLPSAGPKRKASKKLLIKNWPDKAKHLKRDWTGIVIDLGRVLVVAALITFGIAAYMVDGRETSDPMATMIKQASRLFTNVFPIVYTALMGKALRDIALALLIRGTSVMTIEQLLQNNSVGATVVTAIKFRRLHIIPLMLFFVWAFSPLGGQGALRILETQNKIEKAENGVAFYVRPNASTILDGYRPGDLDYYLAVNGLFTSGMVSSLRPDRETHVRDNLGHIKIPRLSSLSRKADENGWVPFSAKTDVYDNSVQYSSFLGIPTITNSTSNRNTFNIETSYFEFHCHGKQRGPFKEEDALLSYEEQILLGLNRTIDGELIWGSQALFHIAIVPGQENDYTPVDIGSNLTMNKRTKPLEIAARFGRTGRYLCSLTEPKVEAVVECEPKETATRIRSSGTTLTTSANPLGVHNGSTAGICEVTAIRQSQSQKTIEDSYTTQFDIIDNTPTYSSARVGHPTNGTWTREYLFLKIGSAGRSNKNNIVNHEDVIVPIFYLRDPDNLLGWDLVDGAPGQEPVLRNSFADMPVDIGLEDFQSRLTILFNGFFHSLQTPFLRSLGIKINRTYVDQWEVPIILLNGYGNHRNITYQELREVTAYNLLATKNTSTTITEIYRINRLWFLVYISSCLVLLLSILSSVSYLLRFTWRASAPDILGYFSTMTRDNPNMQIAEDTTSFAGTTMDGVERAKLLGDLRVRLGDVNVGDQAAGHIALFREDLLGDSVPRLGENPRRRYR